MKALNCEVNLITKQQEDALTKAGASMKVQSLGKIFYVSAIIFLLTNTCCAQKSERAISGIKLTNDGWQTSSLDESGVDSTKLLKLLDKIDKKEYEGIHSILIVKDGKLVFEEYFPGYEFNYSAKEFKGNFVEHDLNTLHNLASVTKSVTSMLFGIAVDKGFIKGVDEKLYEFFPQDSLLFTGNKRNITLQNLLTMSSGLQWNENSVAYGNTTNDVVQLFIVPNPLKYILSKPLADEPGTKFYYNGGGTNVIGKIVQETSGQRLDFFAQKYLFNPLGITRNEWKYIRPDFVYASGDLKLRPRDLAKLGSLVLNKGTWNGTRIVSSEWIEQMTTKHVWMPNDEGYGYQWWLKKYKFGTNEINSYYAGGWGEQYILVFPELNSVAVITGGNYLGKGCAVEIINRFLLPSVKKDFDYDLSAIENSAPLPDSLRIIRPGGKIETNIAAISGSWYGKWDYKLPVQLVVERINKNLAEIVYAWADHPDGYFKKGWMRKTAVIDSSGVFEFETDSGSWNFKYDDSDGVLVGFYKDQYVGLKAIMKRKK